MSLWILNLVAARAAAVTCIIMVTSIALAGDLNPPPGAIAPTMLRLDQIEPRIVVNDLPGAPNAVHVISAPGNYVLTGDITAGAGQHGILIDSNADTVTLDLGDFSIRGGAGSLDGIHVDTPTPASVTLADYNYKKPSASISSFGGNGITVVNAARVSLAGLRVSDCGGNGIAITTSSATIRSDCRIFQQIVTGCGGNGVDITLAPGATVGSLHVVTIEDSDTSNNTGHGVVVRGSGFPPPPPGGREGTILCEAFSHTSIANGGDGIRYEFDGTVQASITRRKGKANSNGLNGVNVVNLSGQNTHTVTIVDDECSSNGSSGLHLQSIGGGIRIHEGSYSKNGGAGIVMSTPTVAGAFHWQARTVDATGNSLQGIVVLCNAGQATLDITESSAVGNGGNGIDVRVADIASCSLRVAQTSTNDNGGGAASVDPGYGIVASGFASGGFPVSVFRFQVEWTGSTSGGNVSDGFHFATAVHDTATASIRNCRGIANGGSGCDIDLAGAPNSNVRIDQSSFHGNFGDGLQVSAEICNYKDDDCDLNTGDGFNIVADSAVLSDCRAISNLGDGMNLATGFTIAISRFECEKGVANNNGGHGIAVLNADLKLRGGSYGGNGGSGVSAASSSLYCSDVTVTDNLTGVVTVDAVRLVLVDCIVDKNSGHGLTVSSPLGLVTGPVTLRRCSFTGNGVKGCLINASLGGQVTECSVFNNGGVGIDLLSSGFVLTNNIVAANVGGNILGSAGSAVGPAVGGSVIGGDNNFANTRP